MTFDDQDSLMTPEINDLELFKPEELLVLFEHAFFMDDMVQAKLLGNIVKLRHIAGLTNTLDTQKFKAMLDKAHQKLITAQLSKTFNAAKDAAGVVKVGN